MPRKDELSRPAHEDREKDREKNIADEGETAGPLGHIIGTFDTDNVGADLGTGGIGAPGEDEDSTEA
jgi:hypothetical protein